jgi:hypothetical protein
MIAVAVFSQQMVGSGPSNIEIMGSNGYIITHYFYVLFSGVGRGLAIGHLQSKGTFKVVHDT